MGKALIAAAGGRGDETEGLVGRVYQPVSPAVARVVSQSDSWAAKSESEACLVRTFSETRWANSADRILQWVSRMAWTV